MNWVYTRLPSASPFTHPRSLFLLSLRSVCHRTLAAQRAVYNPSIVAMDGAPINCVNVEDIEDPRGLVVHSQTSRQHIFAIYLRQTVEIIDDRSPASHRHVTRHRIRNTQLRAGAWSSFYGRVVDKGEDGEISSGTLAGNSRSLACRSFRIHHLCTLFLHTRFRLSSEGKRSRPCGTSTFRTLLEALYEGFVMPRV